MVLRRIMLQVAMVHSVLCNKEKTDWVVKPVGNLINHIYSDKTEPSTRSSLHDFCLGRETFLYPVHISANKFVSSIDNIELIDFVEAYATNKIRYCSNIPKSLILC